MLPGGLNLRRGYTNNVRLAAIEGVDFAGIDVEAGNREALLAEEKGQRQADITHADNADAGLARLDFTKGFCDFGGHRSPPAPTGLTIVLYHATVRSRPSANCTCGS